MEIWLFYHLIYGLRTSSQIGPVHGFTVIIQNEICVVDFTVPWSPACVTMEQNLDDMAKEFPSVKFIKVCKLQNVQKLKLNF